MYALAYLASTAQSVFRASWACVVTFFLTFLVCHDAIGAPADVPPVFFVQCSCFVLQHSCLQR